MTGFARVEGALGDWTWAVEARSVNGRNLEIRAECRILHQLQEDPAGDFPSGGDIGWIMDHQDYAVVADGAGALHQALTSGRKQRAQDFGLQLGYRRVRAWERTAVLDWVTILFWKIGADR